jgi:hypothetical protein
MPCAPARSGMPPAQRPPAAQARRASPASRLASTRRAASATGPAAGARRRHCHGPSRTFAGAPEMPGCHESRPHDVPRPIARTPMRPTPNTKIEGKRAARARLTFRLTRAARSHDAPERGNTGHARAGPVRRVQPNVIPPVERARLTDTDRAPRPGREIHAKPRMPIHRRPRLALPRIRARATPRTLDDAHGRAPSHVAAVPTPPPPIAGAHDDRRRRALTPPRNSSWRAGDPGA